MTCCQIQPLSLKKEKGINGTLTDTPPQNSEKGEWQNVQNGTT